MAELSLWLDYYDDIYSDFDRVITGTEEYQTIFMEEMNIHFKVA